MTLTSSIPAAPTAARASWPWRTLLAMLVRWTLGVTFLWASIPKIVNPMHFLESLQGYKLLGDNANEIMTILLPWTEFAVGICLLSGIALTGAWILTTVLYAMFTVAHLSVLARGMDIDCGCGLAAHDHITRWTLLRSALLFLLTTFALLRHVVSALNHRRAQPVPMGVQA